jgi:hypothetical protein
VKTSIVVALLVVTGSECVAQGPDESRWALELSGGAATFRQVFSTECCGPTRRTAGSVYTVRAVQRRGSLLELRAELGGTLFAGGRRMHWLMPALALSRRSRVTPWLQLGAGVVLQPGQCPADSSDTDPGCDVDLNLGGQLAAGLRLRLAPTWSLGGEVGYVRGAKVDYRYFTAERVLIALRWH